MGPLKRIVLIVLLVVLGGLVLPELLTMQERERRISLAIELGAEREHLFDTVFELRQRSQRNLTNDYSFWDDMVTFAAGGFDDVWGEENLHAGIESFSVNGIWVIGPDDALRYGVWQSPNEETIRLDSAVPLSLERITAAVQSSPVSTFFLRQGEQVLLVMAAGIVPTNDLDRLTPPQGYFVTASVMDDALLDELGYITGSQVMVGPSDHDAQPGKFLSLTEGEYAFDRVLRDDQGEPAAVLMVAREFDSVRTIFQAAQRNDVISRILIAILTVVTAAVLFLLDRSRRRAQDTATRLMELEREKYEFITSVSHQLRTPLSVSNSYAELASDAVGDSKTKLAGDLREYIANIQRANAETGDLLRDMFTIIELGDEYVPKAPERFDLASEFQLLAEAMRRPIEAKKLTLVLDVPTGLAVRADSVRLRQALAELLDNAIDYSNDGGKVAVSAHRDGTRAEITITDNGIGIPAEDMPQLFSKHFRSKNAYAKKNVGTGLGLPIARTIVRGHGGDLGITSKLSEGTQAKISLPIGEQPVAKK